MEIVKNIGNKESVYELIYDEQLIKELISEIIKNCSYRERGTFKINASSKMDAEAMLKRVKDSFGNNIYENISNIRRNVVYTEYSLLKNEGGFLYFFEADEIVIPRLVYFLQKLVYGTKITYSEYESFLKRKEITRKADLKKKIEELDALISQISNLDTKIKIQKLNELSDYIVRLGNIPDFDYEKLSTYYDLVEQAISLELVQETFVYKKQKKSKSR